MDGTSPLPCRSLQSCLKLPSTILSSQCAEGPPSHNPIAWTNGYQPEDDTGSLASDQRRLSEGLRFTRAGTIGSATTLISPQRNSTVLSTGGSPELARQQSLGSNSSPPFEDVLPTRTASSWTSGLSVSGSSGSAERLQNNISSIQQDSDTATESRFRQSSLTTISSQEIPWRKSGDRSCLQPPNLPNEREKHHCPSEVQDAFLQSYNSVNSEVNGDSWLRIATWWLLKVGRRMQKAIGIPCQLIVIGTNDNSYSQSIVISERIL